MNLSCSALELWTATLSVVYSFTVKFMHLLRQIHDLAKGVVLNDARMVVREMNKSTNSL